MKSIITVYPGFQSLPKGVKKMLVVSETFFFREAGSRLANPTPGGARTRTTLQPRGADFSGPFSDFDAAWKN
ncbi:MAG TPA: hypothetical protein VNZ64_17415 [Candidatus Acidoferrum sp.]|jgi:hypothetical protein|nr:hypothetical protein [Candidatus Acidoferrum sp.]